MICSKCIHPAVTNNRVRNTPTFYHTDIFTPVHSQPIKQHHCSATYHSTVFDYPSSQCIHMGKINEKIPTQRKWNSKVNQNIGKCLEEKKSCPRVLKLNHNSELDTEKQNNLRILNYCHHANVSKRRKQIELSSNMLTDTLQEENQNLSKPDHKIQQIQVLEKEPVQIHPKRPASASSKLNHSCCHHQAYKSTINKQCSRSRPVYACLKRIKN